MNDKQKQTAEHYTYQWGNEIGEFLRTNQEAAKVTPGKQMGWPELFEEIRKIVLKSTGIEKVISNIISKMGKIHIAFVRGDYAIGHDTGLVELVVVGDEINKSELERVRKKTEKLIERKISIILLNKNEFNNLKTKFLSEPNLVLMKEGK